MANITFANNAATTLAGAISNTALTCNVAAGSGVLFPQVTTASGDYFCLTFTDAATGLLREIVHVTNVAADTFTIVRAQEGTTALNWLAGDLADNLWTAGSVEAILASTKQFLTANLTVYVATTGSDVTGTGTIISPWATPQHAYTYVQQYYDLSGFSVTVNVANGTYAGGVIAFSPTSGGLINFIGNPGSPSSVVISVTNSNCFQAGGGSTLGGNFNINGFTLEATGSAASFIGYGIATGTSGIIGFENINFGACTSGHIWASDYGVAYATGPYAISGGSTYHYLATSGLVNVTGETVTLTGTPAFSDAFAGAIGSGAQIFVAGNTYSGSATGFRYTVQQNGVVNSGGAGASYLPGSIAGGVATGGEYI